MFPDLYTLTNYYDMGGLVMLPLVAVAVLMWYALAFRYMNVRTSNQGARELIESLGYKERIKKIEAKSVTEKATAIALETAQTTQSTKQLRSILNERFAEIRKDINRHRTMVRSLVAIAPLLGLLGTVDGMIVTFDSLGDMALFSNSGGIAGGISRALFTTQMGLAISIPGLLIGRMIEHRQNDIHRELDQIKDLVCATKHNG